MNLRKQACGRPLSMARAGRRKVVQHDFYDEAEQVAGVVLLNSPANGRWEYEEYLRLLRVRRFNQRKPELPVGRCYFVCADGAYPRLRTYFEEEQRRRPELWPFAHVPLCDAVIGDMDSYLDSLPKCGIHGGTDGKGLQDSMPADGYATVDEVPASILGRIRDRYTSTLAEFHRVRAAMEGAPLEQWDKLQAEHKDASSSLPFWIHIRCQDTNDFMKSLMLFKRLREQHMEDFVAVPPPVLRTESGMRLLETGGAVDPTVGSEGLDIDPQRESDLCAEACKEEAVLLPTYVCFGGLGGRFDHEMAAISVVLAFSEDAHVVLTNSGNTLFACQPDGWTQLVRHAGCEGVVSGLINYGTMKECEVSGLQWNVVIGRGKPSESRELVLGFGKLISACNPIRHEVVTVDLRCLRPLTLSTMESCATTAGPATACGDGADAYHNPPTIFTVERRRGDEKEVGRSH
ncbi:putative thiamine pyrophosphokinase [Trypanosoma conorhini]|uniref:Putative thiamine pyrophosphokinase n=1 Tax=Trypanosoma conorhini TaxID=83891 RepID=A0A3R7K3J7_9TRYP|nr:putative thiamine pyrophosphokinase [Trypanosoma conorhini]RNE99835.1 putative thiamine pyrophosphokinase [Trypanosoma conorhini]